jgi:hypothetical protein
MTAVDPSKIPIGPFLTVLLAAAGVVYAEEKNGFNLSGSLVPVAEIHPGGPPRDGIPAIDRPNFVFARDTDFLDAGDRVLGLVRGGEAKAYPIRIMSLHEIVNDRLDGESRRERRLKGYL